MHFFMSESFWVHQVLWNLFILLQFLLLQFLQHLVHSIVQHESYSVSLIFLTILLPHYLGKQVNSIIITLIWYKIKKNIQLIHRTGLCLSLNIALCVQNVLFHPHRPEVPSQFIDSDAPSTMFCNEPQSNAVSGPPHLKLALAFDTQDPTSCLIFDSQVD